MRIAGFLFIVLLVWPPAATAQEVFTLEGTFRQGGLVIGRTDPRATVEFEGRKVRVSPDGAFLIGFGRDAKPKATLKVSLPDGHVEVQVLEVGQREYDVQRIDGLPKKFVTPSEEVYARIKADNRQIGKVRKRDTPETWFLSGWIWPAEGRISGVYGSQRVLNGKPRRPHYGLDIAGPTGTPVYAPIGGQVVLAETDMYYTGGTVFLDHGHGLTTTFMHMSKVTVEVGQFVKQGEKIGEIGATGRVTGPHLDWRLQLFNTRLDPFFVMPPRAE